MRNPAPRLLTTALVALVLVGSSLPAHATRVRQIGLDAMIRAADRIFVGRCSSATRDTSTDGKIPATRYRFEILEAIHGVDQSEIEFRIPGAAGSEQFLGMPRFTPGGRFLVLLYPDGPTGLTAPVGLGQGKFRIEPGRDTEIAINDFGNQRLFRDVPEATLTGRAFDRNEGQAVDRHRLADLIRDLLPADGNGHAKP